jgi:exonuclease III
VIVGCRYLPNGNPAPGPRFDYKLRWFERLTEHSASLLASGAPVVLAGRIANDAPQIWLPFLDTYRTMCLAPRPDFRRLLEQARDLPIRGIDNWDGRPS